MAVGSPAESLFAAAAMLTFATTAAQSKLIATPKVTASGSKSSHAATKDATLLHQKRVATLVSGTFLRFFLDSLAMRLVWPLTAQGHKVDCFIALSTALHKPWRTDSYMRHLTWDPVFGKPTSQPTHEQIRSTIEWRIASAGGRLCRLDLFKEVTLDDDPRLRSLRKKTSHHRPGTDIYESFPAVSMGAGNVVDANKNMLRLFKALEALWDVLIETEQRAGTSYHYVFWVSDDAWWLRDFDLTGLLRANGAAHAYVLSCDHPPWPRVLKQSFMNDYSILLDRRVAQVFGRLYTWLFTNASLTCRIRRRQCMSEELLRRALESAGVRVASVNQRFMLVSASKVLFSRHGSPRQPRPSQGPMQHTL